MMRSQMRADAATALTILVLASALAASGSTLLNRWLTQDQLGRSFGFEADVALAGLAAGSAGDFLAVDPEANLAIDTPDIIMVPLVQSLAQILGGETSRSFRRCER